MPTLEPTAKQKKVLALVERGVSERGYPPSLRELAMALGLSGTRAVEKHLAALERKGFVRRRPGARALELASRAPGRKVPIVGRVAAGRPLLAEEHLDGYKVIDADQASEGCFLLRVQGESMKDAGILNGDLVLVRPQADAESGEIVVAVLGDEATVKRLLKKKDRLVLQPENPSFRPLVIGPGEPYAVAGKVIGVFRTY
jgi:repressor LexA